MWSQVKCKPNESRLKPIPTDGNKFEWIQMNEIEWDLKNAKIGA